MTIGFSAPAADHGWIAAIANNAKAQAAQFPDVTFEAVNPTNDITQQIAAVETLINKKVSALVILPNDGSQLTSTGRKAMAAGIPVINLDRVFDSPLAYRTWIGGDNYGMGVERGHLHRRAAQGQGRQQPDHRRDRRASTACRSPRPARRASRTRWRPTASPSGPGRPPTSPRRAASGWRPTCCRPPRSWTRCGTTTTTRASACWPRSTRPAAASSSWSAGRARPTRCATSRPTTPCSRPPSPTARPWRRRRSHWPGWWRRTRA